MTDISFEKFVGHWNASQNLTTPDLHLKICFWLAEAWRKNEPALLLMAFRNSGKSTLVGLFAAWLLYQKPSLRILVLAADHALARKMVRNVKRIIERMEMTAHLKPKRADQWASDQFTVNREIEQRDPSMLAKGIGANVTGLRADVIICDDVEVPNTCDTATKRIDLRERLAEIDYILVPGGMQLFVGTPHSYFTIYADKPRAELKEERPLLEGFKRLVLALFNSKGQSRWPERFPPSEIETIRRRTGPNKFKSQMLLEPANIADGRFNPKHLQRYDDELCYVEQNGKALLKIGEQRIKSASCWWDPAYGAPGKGDGSVIAAVFTNNDGRYWLHRIKYLPHDPAIANEIDEATQQCRQVAHFLKELYLPSVHLETNGIGKFLPGLLRRELTRSGIGCAVVEENSRRPKVQRITSGLDAILAARALFAHRSVFETPFITELREWHGNSNTPDDGLDAVSACINNQPVRLIMSEVRSGLEKRSRTDWRFGSGPFVAKTEFQI
jgi:hypothetical protein